MTRHASFMPKRRTTTSAIVALLQKTDATFIDIAIITGEPYNRISAALYWLTECGAVVMGRKKCYRWTPKTDTRSRTVDMIVDGIRRNRGG